MLVCPWVPAQCELDIMFSLEKVHFIVQEMVANGQIVETNMNNILGPLSLLESHSAEK